MPLARSAAAVLLTGAVASAVMVPDDHRAVQLPGLIRYPVVARNGGPVFGKHSNITRRQIEVDSFAKRSGTMYTIDITLGTPGQTVPVQFDTGSSELWVNPVCANSNNPEYCAAQPRFTQSSTIVDLGEPGYVEYGTGYALFQYVYDYVAIGSAKLTQQIFGVAYDSAHAPIGLIGAGPSLDGWENTYDLPIDSLAKQGFINSRAFSMDLRGFDSDKGAVIFGGIDVRKYKGYLEKLPIIPAAQSPDGATRFWVYLNAISVNQPDGNVVEVYTTPAGGNGQAVLLDSGYTLSALPKPIMDKLVAAFPSAEYLADADLYLVDCLDPSDGGSLDFTFGDKVINVRYYDFVWHAPDSGLCVLGAFEDEFPVLGDTFLRAAYVVYDWDNREIHIAETADCGSELVPIGAGPDAVPNIEGKCGKDEDQSSTTSAASSTSVAESTTAAESSVAESTSVATSAAESTDMESTTTPVGSFISTTTEAEASTTTTPSVSKSTITYTTSTTYTVISCPPSVTKCPLHQVTTEMVTVTATVCPETTGTFSIIKTLTCSGAPSFCPYGSTTTTAVPVTVTPVPPTERTTHVVPGCTPGAPGPSDCIQCSPTAPTTLASITHAATYVPTASATATKAVVTAGAARAGVVQVVGTIVAGALAMVLVGM
ncbi:hypothetical protein VTJ49DRAFT_6573 [Mycothermus thermophilus]|uniref:Peptidase A1 domain-containing protein n=1 Tax=Humicola insolens TaxID=85995 RepID=A0ABR3VJ55_HUMIN